MMTNVSLVAHLASTAAAVVAAFLVVRVNSNRTATLGANRVLLAALTLSTVAAALRWVATGHPPVFGTFENTMASSWALMLLALVLLLKNDRPGIRWEATALLVWVPVTTIYGLFFSRVPYPLTISERNILIDIHVSLAWAAYAVLLWACMVALRIVLTRDDPANDSADRALLRSAGLGFVLFTGLILVGAIYSFQLFTRYFTWEIVETLSVCAWLAYSLILHQRLFFGWRGKRLAALVLATLPLLLATYWAWSLFSGTYHFFEITEFRAW